MLVNAVTIGADCVKGILFMRIISCGTEEAIAYAKTSTVFKSSTALIEISFPVLPQDVPFIAPWFSFF
jgi:hypothetical protein